MTSLSRALRDQVHRVSQLDAQRLDDELQSLFLGQARHILRFAPAASLDSYLPELQAALRLIFFANSIAIQKPSPGNAFQNLRYTSSETAAALSRAQRAAHFALSVALPLAWTRLRHHASARDWARRRRAAWRVLNALESTLRLLAFANLAAFFCSGRYRSLADRATRSRLRHIRPGLVAPPAFEFVNSQLVWQGVAEGALLVAPLLGVPGAFARSRVGRRVLAALGVRSAAPAVGNDGRGVDKCAICETSEIVMPHRVLPCRHLFCYVCVATALEKEPGLACRACGGDVHGIERVQYA